MKIAQIAPLYESVPPNFYGGTERIVASLVDALVEQGHDVTLFASGNSTTRAKLINCRNQPIWLDTDSYHSDTAAHFSMFKQVRERAHEFDVLHFHVDLLPFAFFEDMARRVLTTMHGRLDLRDLENFYRQWPQYPLVSISNSQRAPLHFANWAATVYHGLPLNQLTPPAEPTRDYVAFLGRISHEKQPDKAIQLAHRASKKIKLAGTVHPPDRSYFQKNVEPLLNDPNVSFIGKVGDAEKSDLLGNAEALLFPINWPEPFGLVMIEALACGTPVIAWNTGSVPEVIEHGVTGFIVNNDEEAIEALARVNELDRKKIRAEFERRFSAGAMAAGYVSVYEKLCQNHAQEAGGNGGKSVTSLAPEGNLEAASVESEPSTMPYNLYAIKHMDLFAIANSLGDIVGKGDGVFRNDTRVLSEFRLCMGDKPLSLLSASLSQDDVFFNTHATNRPLPPLGESEIPEAIIHIKRSRFLWQERLYERVQLVNYGESDVAAPIELHFAADFHDIFEVRGKKRKARGENHPPAVADDHVRLSYRGLDHITRHSIISFSQAPERLTGRCAEFHLTLPRKQTMELYIEISPSHNATPCRERFRAAAAKARGQMRKRRHQGGALRSSEHVFNSWLEKSRSDLALLTTDLDTGPYPYAGIPWFSTPFGRDAIITAMQLLWFQPEIARGVLAYLAAHQAREKSTFRDSAPGKIMHETRKGEMSNLGEVPFSLYYGGVDTTPLFVMLAGAYAERTGDLTCIEAIWPALEMAMEWVEESDSVKDGFLTYQSGEASGLRNQGWKDSEDSVFHADGRFPDGPISLVEVQGYKFAALSAMAQLCRLRGDSGSIRWKNRAKEIRAAVEQRFWMEERGFYALAIDGEGQLCRVRASNAGHLLFVGLPSAEHAAQVTQQLLSSSFNSGWGIRTLATDEVRYNPMSYHNGSVWPHDAAICAAGIARYGHREGAANILSELFGAAVSFGMRLPELFCGFQRFTGGSPVAYPVACLPQAWSSGSVFMALQGCLGISINGWRKQIQVNQPQLPSGINNLSIRGLRVGESRVNLVFQRVRERVVVFSENNGGKDVSIRTSL